MTGLPLLPGPGTVTPASIRVGHSTAMMMLDRLAIRPVRVGKTKCCSLIGSPFSVRLPASRLGHFSFHSRRVFTTNGPIGIVRVPDHDFGFPMALYLSA